MRSAGSQAPEFTIPGVTTHASSRYDLAKTLDRDTAVVLAFYPFDFSPTCTSELCALRDAEFFEFLDNVTLWAASADSVYAHWAFADEFGLNFPLLSDSDGSVAREFGVCYDEYEGHRNVPKRAVFLIDDDRTVRYAWHTDDARENPDFVPVIDAVERLDRVDDEQVPDPEAVDPGEYDPDVDSLDRPEY
jgi:peroxiredoxin